ncbi:choice-of-anchor I family protein [Psychrobacillus sp. NPDC096623]|uniref:choice-of-anchor I family protein n=1 Tax=Psychrobacillus sp. NPDC096623 TaxID=3364492 RepID=UPI00382A85F3
MDFKTKLFSGITAVGILMAGSHSYNVLAEQPPLFQYKGEDLQVTQIAQYDSGSGIGGTEILTYDEKLKRAFVTNGAESGIDILSFEKLKSGHFTNVKSLKRIYLKDFGINGVKDITSLAAHPTKDLVAVSVVSDPKTDPGYIVFLTKSGEFLSQVQVGSLPDMVTFTPDGSKAIVANEGEPSDDYSVDPEGTVSIIDVSNGVINVKAHNLSFKDVELDDKVHVNSKGTTLQQLEPEYISVSADSNFAYISMQENNAIATLDLKAGKILHVKGLGVKDHSVEGNELDGKRDDKTKIERLPLLGLYMPDAIDTFTHDGKTYILTPNEGDSRDYEAYSEEAEIADIADKIKLKADNYKGYTQAELDKLVAGGLFKDIKKTKITLEHGLAEDGNYEALYTYGGRSFSIFDAATMELVYDSGSEFEEITANAKPEFFNTDNEEIVYDKRSSAKGPEPETAVSGQINGTNYAFIALERFSGIMVYDLSNPLSPKFVTLISSRDFTADIKGDVSPEGLRFIDAQNSPTGYPLLAATHEVSGTVAVYEFGGKKLPNGPKFKDVKPSHWAHAFIEDLVGKGIVKGKTAENFAPEDKVTRIQFAMMIARTLDVKPTTNKRTFTDVPAAAQAEIQALMETGIILGKADGSFKPNEYLTREQMAAIIVRAYEYQTNTKVQVEQVKQYKDSNKISSYAKEAIEKAHALGVMTGNQNGEIQPKVSSSRAQAAKVISEMLSKTTGK